MVGRGFCGMAAPAINIESAPPQPEPGVLLSNAKQGSSELASDGGLEGRGAVAPFS